MTSCRSIGLSIVKNRLTGKVEWNVEMFRWMLVGLLAGLWLSLEETQCDNTNIMDSSGIGYYELFYCNESFAETCLTTCLSSKTSQIAISIKGVNPEPPIEVRCLECVEEQSYCADHAKSKYTFICDLSGYSTFTPADPSAGKTSAVGNKQRRPICKKKEDEEGREKAGKWLCHCNKDCTIVCHQDNQASDSSSSSPLAEERGPPSPSTILLILLLFIVAVFIIVAVVLFMRKRKLDKRNEWSPTTYTSQGDTVTNVYADGTVPAGNHIYDELDMMTLDPTPSNVYSTQPTSVAVDMGRSADYVDIDLPMKDQQKPMNSSKAALSLSPVYSQPFEPSASNTEYAEPFKPDTTNTATTPVLSHINSAAGDQQNDVYSLAKAIPLSDASVIYSQPNKPTKSSESTGKSGGSTDPIHSEATGAEPGAEPGAESRGSATQDPNSVYAEPMKLKKSS